MGGIQANDTYPAEFIHDNYGPNDNFSLETSHVLPALIRKFHEARISHAEKVVMWGTGSPRREFPHVDDMADACVHVMSLPDSDIETHLTHYPSPCFVYDWFVNKSGHRGRDSI